MLDAAPLFRDALSIHSLADCNEDRILPLTCTPSNWEFFTVRASRREQPVPHKRPNERTCQKKGNYERNDKLTAGDIYFVPRGATLGNHGR